MEKPIFHANRSCLASQTQTLECKLPDGNFHPTYIYYIMIGESI
jgi:hypothetical protein